MDYVKVILNGSASATMFIGFSRKLFTPPTAGDILHVDDYSSHENPCIEYMKKAFWLRFLQELAEAEYSGKFANSNASADWMDLLACVQDGKESDAPEEYTDYYTSLKSFLH